MLKYKTVDHTKVNDLCLDLIKVRNEINQTFATPRKELPDLNKSFRLDGLDKLEDYLLVNLATKKGIIKFSNN